MSQPIMDRASQRLAVLYEQLAPSTSSQQVLPSSCKAEDASPTCLPFELGQNNTEEYRMHFKHVSGKQISCWHEIPLFNPDGTFNFVCEIPKETSAKMEIATKESCTPIKQDMKKGKLRHYPYNIHWNYGAMPQTWEDPEHLHEELQAKGDNDPLDVVEIGSNPCRCGGVYRVKVLGVYAMIDDGELDWKVIAIRADDRMAPLLNDVGDVETHLPGELKRIMEWFRDYKIPDGKPANKFGFDMQPRSRQYALKVVEETHEAYVKLKSGRKRNAKNLSLV